jgi:hypothetical protein
VSCRIKQQPAPPIYVDVGHYSLLLTDRPLAVFYSYAPGGSRDQRALVRGSVVMSCTTASVGCKRCDPEQSVARVLNKVDGCDRNRKVFAVVFESLAYGRTNCPNRREIRQSISDGHISSPRAKDVAECRRHSEERRDATRGESALACDLLAGSTKKFELRTIIDCACDRRAPPPRRHNGSSEENAQICASETSHR